MACAGAAHARHEAAHVMRRSANGWLKLPSAGLDSAALTLYDGFDVGSFEGKFRAGMVPARFPSSGPE